MSRDDRLAEALRTFYAPEPAVQPDRLRMTRRVLDEVHHMPRDRGAWLRLPWSRRAPRPPAIPDTDVVPAPTSAANGHTLSVIGRTQTMFSPAKALIAGTLVFALGGVLLVAQPDLPPGASIPGAAIDPCSTPIAPARGVMRWGSTLSEQSIITEISEHIREGRYTNTMQMEDDRLDGGVTTSVDWDFSLGGGGPAFDSFGPFDPARAGMFRGTMRIENADGSWEGPWIAAGESGYSWRSVATLTGAGGYEGLSATLFLDSSPEATTPVVGSIYPTDIAICEFTAAE